MFKTMCLLSAVAVAACGCVDDPTAVDDATTVSSELVAGTVQIDTGSTAASGTWSADKDYNLKAAGQTINHANKIDVSGVANAAPTAIYQTARTGNLTYSIPGFGAGTTNTVRLHFAETYFTAVGARVFNVTVNGAAFLTGFDIFKAAKATAPKGGTGANRAVVQQLTAAASSTGAYVIGFKNGTDQALISGIEIIPGAACTAGAACTPSNVCLTGTISCSTGAPVCVAGAANASANGSVCGTNQVCDNGVCGACNNGAACTPTNVCALGTISCSTGAPVCLAGGANTSKNGAACGTNQVCNNGACGACTAGAACTPTNACHKGTISCSTGTAVCTDTGANAADGASCGGGNVCQAGTCMCHATTANVPAPAAYYPFETNAIDVDHGILGTDVNVVLAPGFLGNAYYFNGALNAVDNSGVGAESFVYPGLSPTQGLAGARTICSWIGEFPPASGPGMAIFSDELNPSQYDHFAVQSSQPPAGSACGGPNEVFMVDGTNGCEPSGLTVDPSVWNYVCYAYDGSGRATFFVNGKSSTRNVPQLTVPSWYGNFFLGNAQATDPNVLQGAFSGYIDEVVMWSSYVPVSAMNFMYNGGNGCKAP